LFDFTFLNSDGVCDVNHDCQISTKCASPHVW
jgi:hypothetical protein